ncbi:hypothetical protein [Coleofasciculus sp. E2-BRE-01]|uniref:hypothetical protein n=1 Tax=Coleofasciculus sp. E2-BRE-01 TaxID=3069524 RepID=UPI0032F87F1A
MMKPKVVVAAVLATSAIATGVVLGSASSAQPCMLYKQSESYQQKEAQLDWLRSPWAIVITLPGIALATALSRGGRAYES